MIIFETDGGSVQTHSENMKFQQHNNHPQQQHNNNNSNNSTSLWQPSIQNPNQHNLTITIDQKDGGSIFAPIVVGNQMADCNMNAVSV